MQLTSISFSDNMPIPGEFAFAVIDPNSHVALSSNRNPQLAWSDVPAGTQSFVLICHDPDVPSWGDFFHWLLLDIPAATREIVAGSHSHGVTPRGKAGPAAPGGTTHGINDYTNWFAGDEQMNGNYYGYDGPCPPWNDALMHHYVFTLYALDIPGLPNDLHLDGQNVRLAIAGHVLAEASLTGTYTLNPKLL
jgi:Raf kinase inhibitor-like YbhB/YbcL family protein